MSEENGGGGGGDCSIWATRKFTVLHHTRGGGDPEDPSPTSSSYSSTANPIAIGGASRTASNTPNHKSKSSSSSSSMANDPCRVSYHAATEDPWSFYFAPPVAEEAAAEVKRKGFAGVVAGGSTTTNNDDRGSTPSRSAIPTSSTNDCAIPPPPPNTNDANEEEEEERLETDSTIIINIDKNQETTHAAPVFANGHNATAMLQEPSKEEIVPDVKPDATPTRAAPLDDDDDNGTLVDQHEDHDTRDANTSTSTPIATTTTTTTTTEEAEENHEPAAASTTPSWFEEEPEALKKEEAVPLPLSSSAAAAVVHIEPTTARGMEPIRSAAESNSSCSSGVSVAVAVASIEEEEEEEEVAPLEDDTIPSVVVVEDIREVQSIQTAESSSGVASIEEDVAPLEAAIPSAVVETVEPTPEVEPMVAESSSVAAAAATTVVAFVEEEVAPLEAVIPSMEDAEPIATRGVEPMAAESSSVDVVASIKEEEEAAPEASIPSSVEDAEPTTTRDMEPIVVESSGAAVAGEKQSVAPFDVSVQQPIPPVEGPRAVSPPSREQRLPAISYADMAKKQQSAVPNEEEPTPNLLKPGTTPGLQGPQKNEFRPQQRQHVLPPSQPVTARFVPSLGGVVRYSGGSGGGEKLDSGLRKAASTMDDSTQQPEGSVLLLISSQSFKREVTIQQNKMSTVLDLYKIPFVTFDGADPANKDRRNELFGLSGLRGQYPQVFITAKENNEMSYWGDYGRFESAHESGTLSSELGGTVLEIDVDASAKNKSNGTDKSYLSASTSSLLVLISRQSLTREVVANQERAFAILKSKGIVFETIDGADPANKDVRNNLFEISGIRAKYPQFFLVQNGEMDFWGDWDRFQRCNEDGSLEQAIVTASTETSQSSLHVVPASTAIACEEKDPFVRVTKSRGFAVELPTVARAAMETTPSAVPVSPDPVTFTEATKTDKVSKPHEVSRSIAKQSSKAVATMALSNNLVTEITVYGATSFVANHALDYLMQVSLSTSGSRTVTLAGRSKSKIAELQARLTLKMTNYLKTISKPKGQCTFDTFVADSSNKVGLEAMARRTKLVINFAGPFTNYGENIVAACAQNGTDYIDITGEVAWAGDMRQKYSEAAEKSGARIISFCGFDSVPSDLAVFAAVVALRKATRSNSEIESATCWHSCLGIANGGTVHSAIGIPMNLRHCFSQPVPFLLNDPLALAHPRTRVDPINQSLKNRMAKVEWLNQLPSFDSILSMGVSAPFFMSVVNAKIVNASAVALNYGPNFAYRERMLPLGMKTTKTLRVLSLFPAMFVQFGILFAGAVLMTPVIGKMIANWIAPPGSGAPDSACKAGYADVYSEVSTAPAVGGLVHRANCSLKFEGDPGNWVTAQCVMEAALSLILEKEKLPSRSKDGFGTPAELLGMVLVNRLQKSSVRPVLIATNARKNVNRRENTTFC